jgi:hypothetical protein
MAYDYSKKLKAEGQQHSNACWAASISWWTAAMALNYKRSTYSQSDLLADFNKVTMIGGGINSGDIRKVCESAKIRMNLTFVSPAKLKTDYNFSSPTIIIYNYPAAGGTHMNVIFDQQGDTVMCMEPFYPLIAKPTGERLGTYIRRPLSFFANSEQVGIGCLPLKDAFTQIQV